GPRQAGGRERRDAQRDDLDVARGAAHARQLYAGLDELALAAPRALEAHDRALVGEAHGARLVAEARGDEARDLRRDVGPQRDDLPRGRLDEPDRRRPPGAAQPQGQRLLVLERRRDDARDPPPLEDLEQRLRDAPPRRRRARREVAHARRQAQCWALAHGVIVRARRAVPHARPRRLLLLDG